jgi:hypothetical protein
MLARTEAMFSADAETALGEGRLAARFGDKVRSWCCQLLVRPVGPAGSLAGLYQYISWLGRTQLPRGALGLMSTSCQLLHCISCALSGRLDMELWTA